MNDERKFLKVLARDIMTENVEALKSDMTIGQAAHLMLRERISGYPIMGGAGNIEGIITITDLFKLIDKISKDVDEEFDSLHENSDENEQYYHDKEIDFHNKIREFKDRSIKQIMSKEIFTISPDTSLINIVHLIAFKNIHTFPVIDKGKLVGIIGRHDVLNAVFTYM